MLLRAVTLVVLLSLAACSRSPAPVARPPANILLVTIDTLRADRLGRGFTPTLDRLASQALRFSESRSVVPLTLPAHASIMTGQLPPAHGIRLNGAVTLGDRPTLASRLKKAGYQTRAVVGAFVLDRRFGLDAGFDEYDDRIARDPDAMDRLQADRAANEVVDRAIALLGRTPTERPWLLWVHVYDPHAPYTPPADALARAAGDEYNGEIAFVDAELTRLFAAVDARPDAANTATIVMGDHGESLREHGEPSHGMLVFEPALRVPLLIKAPGIAPAHRTDPASSVDVLPTALAAAGQPATGMAGHSLLAAPEPDRESYAETQYPTVAAWAPLRALVQDRWKLVVADTPALFDLKADPDEREDLSSAKRPIVQAMSARLDALRRQAESGAPAPASQAVSAETADRLRSLGYVAPSAAPVASAGGTNPATAMDAWAAFEDALAVMNAGRAAQAVASLAKVAASYPGSPIFQSTLARALAASGEKHDALVRLRAAVRRWPADAMMYHDLAVVARDLGLSAEASRAEEAALAINGAEPAALNGKGLLLADAGQDAEAARAFDAAVRLDPTNAVYHANLGNAQRALGDLAAAAEAFRRALALAPRLPDAANGLGAVLVQQKQAAEGVKWLEQAVAVDPNFVEAQLNLGIAFQESGDLARARSQYRKVANTPGPHARERVAAQTLLAQLDKR